MGVELSKRHHPGSRARPVVLRHAGDLERATRNAYRPSPEQAQADNYRMAHVIVGGLPVSIETPKHQFRYGRDPSGSRWHTRMPADYGYIKGSRVDKDHQAVDVYLGPDSYIANRIPVWVVDQVHAHNGVFDEHKCLIGFQNRQTAYETYIHGFSDSKGPKRCGAMTRLTWPEFTVWLKKYPHNRPLSYYATRKSAYGQPPTTQYGCKSSCQCDRCRATAHGKSYTANGGIMSEAAPPVSEPKALGIVQSIWAKVMPKLSAEDRNTMLQEASLLSTSELGKSVNELLNSGDDHGRIGHIEDLWDGPSDDHLQTGGGHGPNSRVAPGTVNVGPSQAASGNNAPKMEAEYSRHSPQGGVQSATEKLGRDVAGIKGAMKSMAKSIEALQTQIEIIKGGPQVKLDETVLGETIGKAVAAQMAELALVKARKSIANAMTPDPVELDKSLTDEQVLALAKAESEEEDKKPPFGGKEEAEKEAEEDEKDKPHFGKSDYTEAAVLRLQAKSRVKKANRALEKARQLLALERPVAANIYKQLAKSHQKKAAGLVASAIAQRGGRIGPSADTILKAIAKAKEVRKNLNPSQADNQDKWPASTEPSTVKAEETAPGAAPVAPTPDMTKAIDQITKAASGLGLLQSTISDLVRVVGGQAQASESGGSGRLPPVFALAKAGGDTVRGVEMQLRQACDDNVLSFKDVEDAKDIVQKARMGLPNDILEVMMKRLPTAAQDIIQRAAA